MALPETGSGRFLAAGHEVVVSGLSGGASDDCRLATMLRRLALFVRRGFRISRLILASGWSDPVAGWELQLLKSRHITTSRNRADSTRQGSGSYGLLLPTERRFDRMLSWVRPSNLICVISEESGQAGKSDLRRVASIRSESTDGYREFA